MLQRVFIAALILGLFATAYFDQPPIKKNTAEPIIKSQRPDIDYYINKFTLVSFDQQGRLDYSIAGESLTHTEGPPSRLLLKQPKTQMHSGKWKNWSLLANQAKFSEATQQWNFSGRVNMAKLDDSLWPLAINTAQLTYDPNNHRLNTTEYVIIKHPYGQSESLGMSIDLNKEKIELTSKVISQYKNEIH